MVEIDFFFVPDGMFKVDHITAGVTEKKKNK